MILQRYKNDKFTKCVHIADIHIRLYKRHEEYRRVFDNFFRDLVEWQNETREKFCIVVAGDIVHAKTDMSPEMVDMASQFLRNLADIAPTFVIAGNHDMNIANPNRLDALSPIVDNLNHADLHYFKTSGIVKAGNINFVVYSISDDHDDWPKITNKNDDIYIGLYHGPVMNAKTDTGYVVTGRHVELDRFDDSDIVMLGDIHRHQVMRESSPIVAYPGSLIQQNHGETLHHHGWLEWDLDTKSFEFHEVKNPFGYVTMTIDGDKPLHIPDLPDKIRLRLFIENIDASGVKKILTLLRKDHDIVEVTINKASSVAAVYDKDSATKLLDVHDVEYQNKLIREYLDNYYPSISVDVHNRIAEINSQLNSRITEDELPRNISWRPINLKFDNLFSYGEGNEIDFESMKGMYGVFSPNASGKTSAFDALCFALYDKTPRAFKGSHIMNTRADECSCELEIEVGTNRYRIVRKGSRRKNGEVKVDVEFCRLDNGEWTTLNGEDRRDTNSIIRSYVGDYDDFVLTNLSVQNQNSLFIDKGQTERKDLLSQFMGLTIFDKLYLMATDEIREISGTLKRFNRDDFTSTLAEAQSSLEVLNKEHKSLLAEIQSYKKEIDDLNQAISEKYGEKIPIEGGDIDIDEIVSQMTKAEINLSAIEVKMEKLDGEIDAVVEELKITKKNLPNLVELESEYQQVIELERELDSLVNELKVLDVRMTEWKKKIDWLVTYEYDPECPYCVNNVFLKDAKQAEKLYNDRLPEVKENKIRAVNMKKELMERKPLAQEKKDYYEAQLRKINSIEKEKLRRELDREKAKHQIADATALILKCNSLIEKYKSQEAAIKKNDAIDTQIEQLRRDKIEWDRRLVGAEKKFQACNGSIQVLESKKNELLARIKEAEELEDTYEAYENYLLAICRDGIPYQLIADIIPTIQTSVNNILNQVVDFTVTLEVDGKNINGRIVYDDNRMWPLELASGMEKFVTGLAIRVSLMGVSSLPRSNFLIIDEGLSVLDSENLSSMSMLFDMLKNEFEFLILISHLDVVRDIADNLIEIKRDNGFSYINVV